MKKIISIILLSPVFVLANDRNENTRQNILEKTDTRVEIARENLDYTPAVRPEASRDLMVGIDRNARNRSYRPNERFITGKLAPVVNANSDKTELSITETKKQIWQNAVAQNPKIFEVQQTMYSYTPVWYMFRELETAKIYRQQEILENISNATE